jgi:hypothetical protein
MTCQLRLVYWISPSRPRRVNMLILAESAISATIVLLGRCEGCEYPALNGDRCVCALHGRDRGCAQLCLVSPSALDQRMVEDHLVVVFPLEPGRSMLDGASFPPECKASTIDWNIHDRLERLTPSP